MNRILRNALNWRINLVHQYILKYRWELKRLFDFSEKKIVKSISVVVVGRNDNYGGDFAKRLQTTIDWNLALLPNPELIYVEWNSVQEKPSDCYWISKRYPNSKCYIVPNEIHQQIAEFPEKMPVMEYFGKNLGIRKASHDWILLINADVYIDPIDFGKTMKLSENFFYGTFWKNIKWDGNAINHKNFSQQLLFVGYPNQFLESVVGNFILTHKKNWLSAQGYDETLNNVRLGVDNDGLYQLLSLGVKPMVLGSHYHMDHPETASRSTNSTHGDATKLKSRKHPYKNSDNWGLVNYPLRQINERTWELQKI